MRDKVTSWGSQKDQTVRTLNNLPVPGSYQRPTRQNPRCHTHLFRRSTSVDALICSSTCDSFRVRGRANFTQKSSVTFMRRCVFAQIRRKIKLRDAIDPNSVRQTQNPFRDDIGLHFIGPAVDRNRSTGKPRSCGAQFIRRKPCRLPTHSLTTHQIGRQGLFVLR